MLITFNIIVPLLEFISKGGDVLKRFMPNTPLIKNYECLLCNMYNARPWRYSGGQNDPGPALEELIIESNSFVDDLFLQTGNRSKQPFH